MSRVVTVMEPILASVVAFIKRHMKTLFIVMGILAAIGGYYYYHTKASSVTTIKYAVVRKVDQGSVSSGIQTTGSIVAAHKLDLNVYKQNSRIQTVNAVNGGHVNAGDRIVSFDKSSASVGVESAKVKMVSSELALNNQLANTTDPNTTILSDQNQITSLNAAIAQAEKDKVTAYRTFLNTDTAPESGSIGTENKQRPTLSGYYTGDAEGVYRITVYASEAGSGYSYTVSGLENGTESVITAIATAVGTHGLKITFPSDVRSGDQWTVAVPNTTAPKYSLTKDIYDKAIITLDQTISGDRVTITSKQQEIKNLSETDSSSYRDLNVSQAQANLSQAKVQLSQNYKVLQEQDIVAPFSGTIEGLENVVVGATPTGGTNDPIVLGTLVSDEFLVKFTLGAVDIAKVKLGQKVQVTVTSFPNMPPLDAAITEISSLPDANGVAQYGVQALIAIPADAKINLREGLLADVEVVEKEVQNVVRVPLSAITYQNSLPQVAVVGDLTDAQRQQIDKAGILSSPTGVFPSYPIDVRLGVVGAFYAEVVSGLDTGTMIIVSQSDTQSSTVVRQQGFGGGGQRTAGTSGTTGAPSGTRTNTSGSAATPSATTNRTSGTAPGATTRTGPAD